jgi:UDP-N-acetylglucosamine transferase subunit ALG13
VIFVITGMDAFPFDRLIRAVDELQGRDRGEEFLVQIGCSAYQPRHVRHERFLSFGRVRELIRESSVVITHAGAGSTLVCIEQGKHPVMVPRLARFGEIVDDHQLPFCDKLAGSGLATVVRDMDELPAAIATARGRAAPADALARATQLTGWLESFWQGLRGGRA